MTITLRCSHCDQQIAIAPRKPGSRLQCPTCGRTVAVSASDLPRSSAAESLPREGGLANQSTGGATVAERQPAVAALARRASPESGAADSAVPVHPLDHAAAAAEIRRAAPAAQPPPSTQPGQPPEPDEADRVVLTRSILVLALLFAIAALACAFSAGILMGRYVVSPPQPVSGALLDEP
jgi:predicted RNA-binding Zn-ribbon protein involved in translation (DUF1610 family)